MNLLLDTHIILWWLNDDEKLSEKYREVIGQQANLCHISAVSIWEICIKSALGKLTIPSDYLNELKGQGFLELPVSWTHCEKLLTLPSIHSDPFDRLLICQALCENFNMITVDENIKRYDVPLLS